MSLAKHSLPVLVLAFLASVPFAQEAAATTPETLSLGVLEAKLRPMTKSQVETELDFWLGLLREKCGEVSETEIRLMEPEDLEDDAVSELSEQAVELRAGRDRLIQRVDVVIHAFEKKGGDVADAKAYVGSVVATPPISNWTAAWTTFLAWAKSGTGGIALAKHLFTAFAIVVAAWLISRLVGNLVERLLRRTARRFSALLRTFVETAISRTVLFFGLLLALSQLGLDMGPMLAAIGALGLVVGLALQGTLSNFASGLLIMVYRPFDVGDVIHAADKLGKVEGMTLVSTTIKTPDNQRLTVPNNMIWSNPITNVTAEKRRRVDMVFGIGYGDDVRKAREVLMDIVKGHEKVLDDPEPVVQVHELGDSSVNFVVRPWVATDDYWAVYWDVTQAVKERFDAEGISIPFPQRDVHVHHELAPAAPADGSASAEGWLRPKARVQETAPAAELNR